MPLAATDKMCWATFMAVGLAASAGCEPSKGKITMARGELAPDSTMEAVAAFLRDPDSRVWLDQLPTVDEIVEAARRRSALGSGATMNAMAPILADGGKSAREQHEGRVRGQLAACRGFLNRHEVPPGTGLLATGLLWGHPWRSDKAPKGHYENQPELEIIAGQKHLFFLVKRGAYDGKWRLLGAFPLGSVDIGEEEATIQLCFSPPGYEKPESRPTSTHGRSVFSELSVPDRPGFVMEFRYGVAGEIPSAGRLLHMHRDGIGFLEDSFLGFTNQALDESKTVSFAEPSPVFKHFRDRLSASEGTLESLRLKGTPEYQLRELRLQGNLVLRSVALCPY
jgi:hypothetical protein